MSACMRAPTHRAERALPLVALVGLACGPGDGREHIDYRLEEPFMVSSQFAPTGLMGDGEDPAGVQVDDEDGACPDRLPGTRGECYRITYRPLDGLWAGMHWQFPGNNWGQEPGKPVAPVFSTVRLVAAVAEGEQSVVFTVGGVGDASMEHRDTFKAEQRATLTTEWTELEIDIGDALAHESYAGEVIGAFGWTMSYPAGTDAAAAEPKVLYIDDIEWR